MLGLVVLPFCLNIDFLLSGKVSEGSGERFTACLTVSVSRFSDSALPYHHWRARLAESDRRHERSFVHSSQECRLRCKRSPGSASFGYTRDRTLNLRGST